MLRAVLAKTSARARIEVGEKPAREERHFIDRRWKDFTRARPGGMRHDTAPDSGIQLS